MFGELEIPRHRETLIAKMGRESIQLVFKNQPGFWVPGPQAMAAGDDGPVTWGSVMEGVPVFPVSGALMSILPFCAAT